MDSVFLITLSCLVILLVSIRVSSDSSNCFDEYCFTYSGSDVNRSFDGARSWCANNNSSTLAVVSNKSSHDALVMFLSSSKISSQIYVNAKVMRVTETTSTIWYLISGEPFLGEVKNQTEDRDNKYTFYTCLQIWSQTFAIVASSPHEKMNYICSYKKYVGNFPPSISYSYNGLVYVKYENETLNWFEARNRCYLNGGDLATFLQLSEFNTSWLNLSCSYWIGIRFDKWRWEGIDDHQEVIYTRWSVDKPNIYTLECICADAMYSWNWTDCDCSIPRPFVCATYRGPTTATSPSIDPNSPTSSQRKTPASQTADTALAIGVGVGVGGGVLIILVVVVIIIIIVVKKRKRQGRVEGKPQKQPKESKKSAETPVKQPTPNTGEYAEILAASQPGPKVSVKKPVVYSTPEFVETK